MDPAYKILAVLGNTQFGKSSFLNLVSGCDSLRVGVDDGRSCTREMKSVRFRDWLRLFPDEVELRCFDVPGYGDTDLRVTNGQISDSIKLTLAGLGSRLLDALLVFQSIAESAISLASVFSRAEAMFGPDVLKSAIVIITKSDITLPVVIDKRMGTIDSLCRDKGIPYVMWVNKSEFLLEVPEEQLANQASALRTALASIQSLTVTSIEEFEHLVKARAQEMMARDPTNTVKHKVSVPSQSVHTYTVQETYAVPSIKPKYTEEEVKTQARALACREENKKAEVVTTKRQVPDFAYDVVTDHHTERVRKWFLFIPYNGSRHYTTERVVKRPIQREVTEFAVRYVQQPAETFEPGLREQRTVQEEKRQRDVEKFRVEDSQVEREVITTRRDAEDYMKKASKQMARERWRQPNG